MNISDFETEAISGNVFDLCKTQNNVVEAKVDGVRAMIGNLNGQRFMHSRNKVNGVYVNYADVFDYIQVPDGIVVDGELAYPGKSSKDVMRVFGSSPEQAKKKLLTLGKPTYYIFDALCHNNLDMRGHSQLTRRLTAELIAANMNSYFVTVAPVLAQSCSSFALDSLLAQSKQLGYEGLVIKDRTKSYDGSTWGKVKGSYTYDFVIVGFEDSKSPKYQDKGIAALRLGLYNKDGKLVFVTKCSGLTDIERFAFYQNKTEYIGKVVEVSAERMFETGALRHPSYLNLRPDLTDIHQTFKKYNIDK